MAGTDYVSMRRLAEYHDQAVIGKSELSIIAAVETSPSVGAHSVGAYLSYNGNFYKVISAIAVGDTLAVGTNIQATTVGDELKSGGGGGGGGSELDALIKALFTGGKIKATLKTTAGDTLITSGGDTITASKTVTI